MFTPFVEEMMIFKYHHFQLNDEFTFSASLNTTRSTSRPSSSQNLFTNFSHRQKRQGTCTFKAITSKVDWYRLVATRLVHCFVCIPLSITFEQSEGLIFIFLASRRKPTSLTSRSLLPYEKSDNPLGCSPCYVGYYVRSWNGKTLVFLPWSINWAMFLK